MGAKEWSRIAVTGVVVCLMVAGCAPGSGTAEQEQGPSTGSGEEDQKDRLRWALPLDAYTVDQTLGNAAEAVLVEECMQDNGFDYRRPQVDVSARSETALPLGRELFTVETATRWGYGGGPDPNVAILRAAEEASASWSAEQQAQYSSCLDVARDELPTDGVRIDNTIASFAMAPWTGALHDPVVVAAAEEWVACVQPLGFTDVPSSPEGGMPTESMSASFGEVVDGMANEQTPEQEAEEIRLATFDAECRESSGYAQALYDAEWDRQMTVVAENEDALATLLEEKNAFEKQAQEILDGAGVG